MKKWLILLALCLVPTLSCAETYYYNPDGGARYHRNSRCPSISAKYHQGMQAFDSALLDEEPYASLKFCGFCIGWTPEEEPTPTSLKITTYSPEAAAQIERTQGIGITGPGEYRIGQALPAGLYTLHRSDMAPSDIVVQTASGENRVIPQGGYYSMYLAEGDQVTLSELSTLEGMHTAWLFQEAKAYPITLGRYLAYVNMPGREYTITAASDDAYVEIATADETSRKRIALKAGESILLNLQPEGMAYFNVAWPRVTNLDTGESIPLGFDAQDHVFVEIRDCTLTFPVGLG